MEEKKTNSTGKTVAVAILIVLLVVSLGYIGYDKFLKSDDSKELTGKTNKAKEEKLDINSRLVKNLYRKVSTGKSNESEKNAYFNYMYKDSNYKYADFYADKANEQQKMQILSRLINQKESKWYNCENNNIPETLASNSDYKSICSLRKEFGDINTHTGIQYTKEYISNLYKELYGSKAKLDTNAVIYMGVHKIEAYSYIESIDSYLLYMVEGGGTTGPGGSYANITKAVKTNNQLKIYEKVTNIDYKTVDGVYSDDESNKVTTTINYVYTFNLEDDGMYSFYSRVKES